MHWNLTRKINCGRDLVSINYFFFIYHLILFFLALNLRATRSSTQISYTTSVEESIYSSKLEIHLSCNSSVSVGSKMLFLVELEDSIQLDCIFKRTFVQTLQLLWSDDCFQYLQYSRAWGLSYTSGSVVLCINNKKALHQITSLLSIKCPDF